MKSGSKQFPGFDSIFLLGDPGGNRAFRADFGLSPDDAFAVTRAEFLPPPVDVRWAMGEATPRDVIRTTLAAPLIISDRILEIFTASRFTGWTTYPIDLRGRDGLALGGYQGFAVHGRCGPIDNARSVEFEKQMPGGVFSYWRGAYFDESTWDGSHLFMPGERWAWILVTAEVRDALAKAKVKNVHFTSLAQIERLPIELQVHC
jgi:hypothetical protein